MQAPATRSSKDEVAYLDRPTPFGITPAFWRRPDVKRYGRPIFGGFLFVWLTFVGSVVDDVWLRWALTIAGLYAFQVLLEAYLRVRIQQRRALLAPKGESTCNTQAR